MLLLAALGTSDNPWGYITDMGGYSQGLFIVGVLQVFEAFFVAARSIPERLP